MDEQVALAVGRVEWAAAAAAGVIRRPTQEAVAAFLEGPYSTTMDALAAAEATGDPAVLSAAEGACAEVQAELDAMLAGEADSPSLEAEAGGPAAGHAPEIPASAAEGGTERSESRPAGIEEPRRDGGQGQGLPAVGAAAERGATLADGVRQALPEWAVPTMRAVQDLQTGVEALQQQLAARSGNGAAQGHVEQIRLPRAAAAARPAAAAPDGLLGAAAASAGPAAFAALGGRSGAAAASGSTAAAASGSTAVAATASRPDTAPAVVQYARLTDELSTATAARSALPQQAQWRADMRSLVAAVEGRLPLPSPAAQPATTPADLQSGSAAATGTSQLSRFAPQRAQRSNRQQQPPQPIVRWPPGIGQSRVLVLPRNRTGVGRPQAQGQSPAAAHPQTGEAAVERMRAASPRRRPRPAAAAVGAALPEGASVAAAGSEREASPRRRRRPAAAAAAGISDVVPAQGGSGAAAASRSGGSPRRRRRRAAAAAAVGDAAPAEGSSDAARATDQLRDGPSSYRRQREHGAAAAASADASLIHRDEGGAVGSGHSEREERLQSRFRRVSLLISRHQREPGTAAEAGVVGQGADPGADAHRHRRQLPPSGYGARIAGSHLESWHPSSVRAGSSDEGAPQTIELHRAGQRGECLHLVAINLRPGICQQSTRSRLNALQQLPASCAS